jgi:ribosomal protein S18 acetylase RimI-like enzyme
LTAVAIRPARAEDHAAYVRLFAELGVDDPPAAPERFVREQIPRMVVAERGGVVVGYGLYEVLATSGYIRNIATAPAARRTGVGRALMAAMRDRFRTVGATTWRLNVKADNAAAIALYEGFGMRVEYRSTVLRFATDAAMSAAPGLMLCEVRADDDASAEPRFGLLAGQLASARAKSGRSILGLRRAGELVGIAVFMPAVPGAFPFRTVEPELGPPFVSLLRPLAAPGKPWIQVTPEGDDALVSALASSGATIALELLHLSSPLSSALSSPPS